MKIQFCILLIFTFYLGNSQDDSFKKELIELANIYKKYHVIEPTDSVYLELGSIQHEKLYGAKNFISELIKESNNITDDKYLIKPDSNTLWNLYLVRGLTWNMFSSQFKGSNKIDFGLDSLITETIEHNEQFANYYSMLFTSILNKNRPLDMSRVNFDMEKFEFKNETEKGIFFLESMETLGTLILGYFYIDPPNFDKAMTIISNYPKFDNEEYYYYLILEFDDFLFTYSGKDPKGSYKNYQINKLMNTMLRHAMCLSKNGDTRNKMNDILSNSILANKEYWKYSETPEVFEQIYSK